MQLAALKNANLTDADMWNADLTSAFSRNTNLEGADIKNARFEKAVDLTPDQIRSAKHWDRAHYSSEFYPRLVPPTS